MDLSQDIKQEKYQSIFSITVIVAALGYFVDMYDLILFGIVRVASLTALGYTGSALVDYGVLLLNTQMGGMLLGGILWGVLGDKKGRLYVLFGSILMYSLANIGNAFVTDITTYAIARFIAGIGLAGELGAAITLVSEILPQKQRGYGTAIVASVGLLGAVTAAFVGDFLNWKIAYLVGGGLGLALLILRFKMLESGMYNQIHQKDIRKGDFISLFTNWERFSKYMKCVLIGFPMWFVVGVLITFSPEFATRLGVLKPIIAGKAIMFTYIGIVIGDVVSGVGSQLIKSRKKTILAFKLFAIFLIGIYLYSNGLSSTEFYTLCGFIGFAMGYWAVFVTIGAEQFGTNLRATVATTVPNFVRGATIPITLAFKYLINHTSYVNAATIVGSITFIVAFIALYRLDESYHKDLDYLEKYN